MKYVIHDAVPADLPLMAAVMRPEDVEECYALGSDPLSILYDCLSSSVMASIGYVGDEPVAICGLIPLGGIAGARGCPWLFTGRLVEKTPIEFMRLGKIFVARMLACYPTLENAVDLRYTRCHRWLEATGFKLGATVPVGPYGMPFRQFKMERGHVAAG